MIGAQEAAEAAATIPVPVLVALIGVAGSIGVAALTAAVARFSDATERRRDGYAQAVRNLVRWCEYPYRIRRRTSDAPDVLAALAAEGHAIQEDLRCSETWVTADRGWASDLYREVRKAMAASVGKACTEAWAASPVTTASQMNLGEWGPTDAADQVMRFEKAVRLRFGLWRTVTWIKWIRGFVL